VLKSIAMHGWNKVGAIKEKAGARHQSQPVRGVHVTWWELLNRVGIVITIVGAVTIYPSLFVRPSIDRDVVVDDSRPLGALFVLKNNSPLFSLHNVVTECIIDDASIGGGHLGNNVRIPQAVRELSPGQPYTFGCDDFVRGNQQFKTLNLTLRIDYQWFWQVPRHVELKLRMRRDAQGKPLLIFPAPD
jgi:hypothetical protein